MPPSQTTGDPIHQYYREQYQINGGRNNQFAFFSTTKGLAMGFYDTSQLPLARWAQQYTLADNFFHAAFGGSFLNHFWLVCACTPFWPNPPADTISSPPITGFTTDPRFLNDRNNRPDFFTVNTTFSTYVPFPSNVAADHRLPPQTLPHIGDRLDAAGITWAWYSGGWNNAVAGRPDPLFQFHHQPFNYFQDVGGNAGARLTHLKDETDFVASLQNGTLPHVSWIKPIGQDNEHPGYTDVITGERHVDSLLQQIQASPYWARAAVFITYDEHGGFWDHVAPPVIDEWGPGLRVPTLIISPFAKRGFIDHTQYDTTSILKFIETRWNLAPLGTRDAATNNLVNAFSFPSTVVTPGQNAPPRTGQAGTSCATQAGAVCQSSGMVQGSFTASTSNGPMTFSLSGFGPTGTAVGGTPALFVTTTSGEESFPCGPINGSLQTICAGRTTGTVLQGATADIRFPLAVGGTGDVTGLVTGPGAQSTTVGQALAQVTATQNGLPCASIIGQSCQVAGGVQGTGSVTSSMSWTLTATVPAGTSATIVPVAVFSTGAGKEGFPCAAVTAAGGTVSCSGVTTGSALQGSTVTVVFGPGSTVTGTVNGTAGGAALLGALGALGGLPPLPPPVPPLPPFPPPPLLPPLPPMALPGMPGTWEMQPPGLPGGTSPEALPTPTPAPSTAYGGPATAQRAATFGAPTAMVPTAWTVASGVAAPDNVAGDPPAASAAESPNGN